MIVGMITIDDDSKVLSFYKILTEGKNVEGTSKRKREFLATEEENLAKDSHPVELTSGFEVLENKMVSHNSSYRRLKGL